MGKRMNENALTKPIAFYVNLKKGIKNRTQGFVTAKQASFFWGIFEVDWFPILYN